MAVAIKKPLDYYVLLRKTEVYIVDVRSEISNDYEQSRREFFGSFFVARRPAISLADIQPRSRV